jgi:hypothetical protein
MATDPFTPDRPLTSTELTRLGAALHVYGARHKGTAYVVMSTAYPHDVLGVVSTRAAANALLTKSGETGYEVYGPFDASAYPTYTDALVLSAHDGGTQNLLIDAQVVGLQGPPTTMDFVTITLDVAWKPGGPTAADDRQADNHFIYDLPRTIDSIFLTRGSREAFMYPRYQIVFGARHVGVMRQRMGEPPERYR